MFKCNNYCVECLNFNVQMQQGICSKWNIEKLLLYNSSIFPLAIKTKITSKVNLPDKPAWLIEDWSSGVLELNLLPFETYFEE